MAVYAFTQVKGGAGTTTLAANLANAWPNQGRVLLELAVGGGALARSMGYDTLPAATVENPAQGIYDFAVDQDRPKPLQGTDPSSWLLPVLPAPQIPDYPHPGEKMWWQQRVEFATGTDLDVICDLGPVAPEHLMIHNRIMNAATVVVAVVRNLHDARFAAKRLALYHDKLALVMISPFRTLASEVSEAAGSACLQILPWDDAVAENLWRGILLIEQKKQPKPVKEYASAVAELAEKIAGA